jgi:hypothetical protein
MNRWFLKTVLFFVLVLGSLFSNAGEPLGNEGTRDLLQYFQQGNKSYLEGDYIKAVAEYEKVQNGGMVHPDLYFNLANAYYRANRKGLSILYYEKALNLNPSDTAAISNLSAVRKELIDRVIGSDIGASGEPLWQDFLRGLSVGGVTVGFLSFYFVAFGVMIARRFARSGPWRRLLFWINVPLLSLVLVFGILFAGRIYVEERVHHAVVVAGAASLLEGPDRMAKSLMEVHEGLKVRWLSEVGDYARVRLSNGVEGFIQNSQIGKI